MATTYPPDHEVKSASESLENPVEKPSSKSASDRMMYAWSFDDHDNGQVPQVPEVKEAHAEHPAHDCDCPPEAYLG